MEEGEDPSPWDIEASPSVEIEMESKKDGEGSVGDSALLRERPLCSATVPCQKLGVLMTAGAFDDGKNEERAFFLRTRRKMRGWRW